MEETHYREPAPPPPTPDPRRALVREVLVAFLVSLGTTIVLYRLRFVPLVGQNLHALVGLAFLLIPISILQRRGESFERFGIALGGLLGAEATGSREPAHMADWFVVRLEAMVAFARDLAVAFWKHKGQLIREIGFAVAVVAVIAVPFFFGFRIYWHTGAFHFRLTGEFVSVAFAQFVVVALPEEFFYRGYVQTRLGEILPKRFRLLGSPYGLHVVATSVLFALGHFLVDFRPDRLGVFFPALLFGWIRERRGGIGASVFVHALCNVLADVLVIGYGI